jgi:mono/diheme cytochrome c family protein
MRRGGVPGRTWAHIRQIMGRGFEFVVALAGHRRPAKMSWEAPLIQIVRGFLSGAGVLACITVPVLAEDLEAGKSGAAIFSSDCSACHRSAQGLARGMGSGTLLGFLSEHYTTGPSHAASVASYLMAVAKEGRRGGNPQAARPATGYPADPVARRKPRDPADATLDPAAGMPVPSADVPGGAPRRAAIGPSGQFEPASGSDQLPARADPQRARATATEGAPRRSRDAHSPTTADGAGPDVPGSIEPRRNRPAEPATARHTDPTVRASQPAEPNPATAVPAEAAAPRPETQAAARPNPVRRTPDPSGTRAAVEAEGSRGNPPRQHDQPAFSVPSP